MHRQMEERDKKKLQYIKRDKVTVVINNKNKIRKKLYKSMRIEKKIINNRFIPLTVNFFNVTW